jgi:predicted nucleic acid-binding protein
MTAYLLDTCLIIDYLRDRKDAIEFVGRLNGRPFVSVVTAAELYAGARTSAEHHQIEELLTQFLVCEVNLQIAELGGLYCRQYTRSHGVEIPDALIGATAGVHGLTLVTRNVKHFPMLENVVVPYA